MNALITGVTRFSAPTGDRGAQARGRRAGRLYGQGRRSRLPGSSAAARAAGRQSGSPMTKETLWGSISRPELLTCGDPPSPAIEHDRNVSLRLLYLIFNRLLSWLILLGRASTSKCSVSTVPG